ncbi:hypothetical protein Tco_0775153 [Tanacetum coccineum]
MFNSLHPPYTPQHKECLRGETIHFTRYGAIYDESYNSALTIGLCLESATRILNMGPTKKEPKRNDGLLSSTSHHENKIVVAKVAEFFEEASPYVKKSVGVRSILEKYGGGASFPGDLNEPLAIKPQCLGFGVHDIIHMGNHIPSFYTRAQMDCKKPPSKVPLQCLLQPSEYIRSRQKLPWKQFGLGNLTQG